MLRSAFALGLASLVGAASAGAPPRASDAFPQGQERSPTEREFFVPMPAPPNLADTAPARSIGKRLVADPTAALECVSSISARVRAQACR